MRAMILERITEVHEESVPLTATEMPVPEPGSRELLIRISACGVCHTELDEIEGRTPPPRLPVIPGHQIVGHVEKTGNETRLHKVGDRVGVAWIYSSCGICGFCRKGEENLCQEFKATGRDAHGGYAEYMVVPEDFAFGIPEIFSDTEAAPLLCAGAIGYRSLRLTEMQDGDRLGLTGFGGSAHLVLKMVREKFPRSQVFVFARSERERGFARELGAVWSGDTSAVPPEPLDAVIDTTPAWKPVVEALKTLRPGGRLVINAIRKEEKDKEELLRLKYETHLWMEKEIKSVANVTPTDVREFLEIASEIPIRPVVEEFSLEEANRALIELKSGRIRGAKVLRIEKN